MAYYHILKSGKPGRCAITPGCVDCSNEKPKEGHPTILVDAKKLTPKEFAAQVKEGGEKLDEIEAKLHKLKSSSFGMCE